MASDVFGIVGSTVAGAFRVEAVVAEGGFAVVYRAYHEGFRAPVALKCLKIPVHMSQREQDRFEQQFGAEAELLFKLSAAIPTVVRPLHVEVVTAPDGTVMPFLALEWLEGETLEAVARRRRREGRARFVLGELLPALAPVAKALERAHRFNGPDGPISIVHRDMKPENIFVARVAGERVVKILDFGIAQAMSMVSLVVGGSSDAGAEPFTPAYAAPEQWAPQRFGQTGPWTDVWGLALTLVELLAGRPIMDGDNAAMMGTALDPARRPTPRNEGASVNDAVEMVFARALALDPRDRYCDVGEFWRALVQAAREDRVRAGSGERPAAVSGAHRLGQSLLPVSAVERRDPIPDLEPAARTSRSPPGGRGSGASSGGPRTIELEPVGTATPSRAPGSAPALQPVLADSAFRPVSAAPTSTGVTGPPRSLEGARAPTFEPRSRGAELAARFGASAAMVLAGVLITIVEGAYASSKGEVLTIGPLRPGWIAGALVLGGIGLALFRLRAEP